MKKALIGIAATIVGALIIAMPAQSAHAVEDPYEDGICSVSISPTRVVGGQDFTVTVRSDSPRDLSVSFDGQTRSRDDARELVATFRAPTVSSATTAQVTATCGDQSRVASFQILAAAGAASGPGGSGSGGSSLAGILPNTGGVAWWLLLVGLVAAVVGGAVTVRRRA